MKKKFFAVALATTMAVSTAMTAMAETKDVTIAAGFSANTGEEKLSGDFDVTYTFNNKSNGTNNWDNFIVEIHTAGDAGKDKDGNAKPVYIDARSDNFGWLANQTDGAELKWADLAEGFSWDNYAADMKAGMDCTVKITRKGNDFTIKMDEGGKYSFTATVTAADFAGQDAIVYLTGENCALTNVKFANGGGTPDPAPADPTSGNSGEKDTTTKAATATTTAKSSTTTVKTGDVAPITALAAVAVVACAAVVVSRKKVTE